VFGQRGMPRRPVLVAYIGWSFSIMAIAAYGLGQSVAQLLCFGFVGGIGMAIGNALWGTLMHQNVPRHILGRVTSVDWMVSLSLWPLAAAGAGLVANVVGARMTLVGAGGLGLLVCLGFLAALGPKLEPAGERAEP